MGQKNWKIEKIGKLENWKIESTDFGNTKLTITKRKCKKKENREYGHKPGGEHSKIKCAPRARLELSIEQGVAGGGNGTV